jgi:hypothetical protein
MCNGPCIDQGMLNRQRGMGQCPGASPSTIGMGGTLLLSADLRVCPAAEWLILGPYRATAASLKQGAASVAYAVYLVGSVSAR